MMTQTEYENQGNQPARPSAARIGSVVIEQYHKWTELDSFEGRTVETRVYRLNLWGEWTREYRTNPKYNTGTLWTMDGDGNVKSPSVFREPLEVS